MVKAFIRHSSEDQVQLPIWVEWVKRSVGTKCAICYYTHSATGYHHGGTDGPDVEGDAFRFEEFVHRGFELNIGPLFCTNSSNRWIASCYYCCCEAFKLTQLFGRLFLCGLTAVCYASSPVLSYSEWVSEHGQIQRGVRGCGGANFNHITTCRTKESPKWRRSKTFTSLVKWARVWYWQTKNLGFEPMNLRSWYPYGTQLCPAIQTTWSPGPLDLGDTLINNSNIIFVIHYSGVLSSINMTSSLLWLHYTICQQYCL